MLAQFQRRRIAWYRLAEVDQGAFGRKTPSQHPAFGLADGRGGDGCDADAFGVEAARRLDRMGPAHGDRIVEALDRFDAAWPGLRARVDVLALSASVEEGLVRVRLRCLDEATASEVESEARSRSVLSPLPVESIVREGRRVEIAVRLADAP